MTTYLLVAVSFLAVVFAFFMLKFRFRLNELSNKSEQLIAKNTPVQVTRSINEPVDFRIENEFDQQIVAEGYEIARFPRNSIEINPTSELAKQSTHFISDIVKGAVGIPDKTVELVFKAEIAKGLNDGRYVLMQTKNGETLADAIDATGKKIVGKGRIVEGGKLKQFTVGAYNLLSIAVAQSHLANIDNKLAQINNQLKDIKDKLSNNDCSEFQGAIDYYTLVTEKISFYESPTELSEVSAVNLEQIHKDSHVWRNKVFKDFNGLIKKIQHLEDQDNFGSENTYKRFLELIEDVELISHRYALLLQLSLISKTLLYYLDPVSKRFTKIVVDIEKWKSLINDFDNAVEARVSKLFNGVFFNESSTLECRRQNILLTARVYQANISNHTRDFIEGYESLERKMMKLMDSNEIRIAVAFDSEGQVARTALIS